MSAQGFRPVMMVGAIAATALSCYMVSLRVASERAALESVENKIVLAQRDIRLLETEIGTRGRLAQLERWNVKVIRLSAPTADQFVDNGFQLATLTKPDKAPAVEAPIVLASAPAPTPRASVVTGDDGRAAPASRPLNDMMHVAGYKVPEPRATAVVRMPSKSEAAAKASSGSMAKNPSPVRPAKADATKKVKTATADPLAPLSGGAGKAKAKPGAAGSAAPQKQPTKDPGSR